VPVEVVVLVIDDDTLDDAAGVDDGEPCLGYRPGMGFQLATRGWSSLWT
jgi:hypothetical protein